MIMFSTFIWIYIQTWNCINTRNLDKLYEKSNDIQFIYLGIIHDNPERNESN